MKKIELHPLSVAAGAGIAVLGMLAIGAQSPTTVQWPKVVEHVVKVKGIPTPEEMVRIVEGEAFTVPTGMRFVATGAGVDGEATPARISISFDGEVVFYKQWRNVYAATGTFAAFATDGQIPPGLVAPAGTVVTVDNNLGAAYRAILLGYLADA